MSDKIDAVFIALVRAVQECLPDLGKQLAQQPATIRAMAQRAMTG